MAFIENKLKGYRQAADLKQADLANYLKITVRHYQAIETGTSDGSLKLWMKLSKLFNTSINGLLEQDADANLLVNVEKIIPNKIILQH